MMLHGLGGGHMEVDRGFIVGIYNYCDRWCAKCRFTSRCRVFADCAEHEAAATPELAAVREAPQHPSDYREAPGWMEEALAEIGEAPLAPLPEPAPLPERYSSVIALSDAYCDGTLKQCESMNAVDTGDLDHPVSILQ